MPRTRVTLVLTALVLTAAPAAADILTVTFSGTASGTLNGTPFSSTAFTITATADTTARQPLLNATPEQIGWSVDHTAVTVDLAGIGSFSLLTPTRTFVNNNSGRAGFSRGGAFGTDLIYSTSNPALTSWDMLSGVNPITGNGVIQQWTLNPQISTSGGILIFDQAFPTTTTFAATIPAPATLMAFGILSLAARRRR